jgi:hypothetical protein
MDNSLVETLRSVLDLAYPDPWRTEWLSLPPADSSFGFLVMCSDLPSTRAGKPQWPPASRDPKVWIHWSPSPGRGFWVRPRKYAPVLRDRFILVEAAELVGLSTRSTIDLTALIDAFRFSADSGRIIWHNSPKGGARSPRSAHFQSMPVYQDESDSRELTLPCCRLKASDSCWNSTCVLRWHIIQRTEYPVLGLVVWGPIVQAAELVWNVISDYDSAQACNIVVEPDHSSFRGDIVRVFVFPRARIHPNCTVTVDLLHDDERVLMKNDHGGVWCEWPFAGVEMGLLTQVDWGPLFEEMREQPERYSKALLRLVRALSLEEADDDWKTFLDIIKRHTEGA